MRVFDYTHESDDGHRGEVDLDSLSLIYIHRIGPGIGSSAVEISRFFQTEGKKYTGGNMAYTLVGTDKQVQQALPLNEKGAHGRRFGNAVGIGFAQIGDFNKVAPSHGQWLRAVDLCADLVPYLVPHSKDTLRRLPGHLRYGVPVVGHGEIPGTFGKNSGKEQPGGSDACPGRLWDMDSFRRDVLQILRNKAGSRLMDLGVRFKRS